MIETKGTMREREKIDNVKENAMAEGALKGKKKKKKKRQNFPVDNASG